MNISVLNVICDLAGDPSKHTAVSHVRMDGDK